MQKPAKTEAAPYYHGYIDLVPKGNIINILEKQNTQFCTYMANVGEEQAAFRYAKGKWNIKEIIGHLVESELVYSYRAMCISRGEKTPLPGYDQQLYVSKSNYSGYALSEAVEQFYLYRNASVAMFSKLDDKMWKRSGIASGHKVSVRALAYIMAGHVIHHMKVINSKYLNGAAK